MIHPHENKLMLHRPGQCVLCDGFPVHQRLRRAWGLPFTDAEYTGHCDRCKKKIPHFVPPTGDGNTAGYYLITKDNGWSFTANEGEAIVCDSCIHEDTRYIEVFGSVTNDATGHSGG